MMPPWLRDAWDDIAWKWRRWRENRAWVKAGRPELKPLRLPPETWTHVEVAEWLAGLPREEPQPDDYIVFADPPPGDDDGDEEEGQGPEGRERLLR